MGYHHTNGVISIHAAREGGDVLASITSSAVAPHFNPRRP